MLDARGVLGMITVMDWRCVMGRAAKMDYGPMKEAYKGEADRSSRGYEQKYQNSHFFLHGVALFHLLDPQFLM